MVVVAIGRTTTKTPAATKPIEYTCYDLVTGVSRVEWGIGVNDMTKDCIDLLSAQQR